MEIQECANSTAKLLDEEIKYDSLLSFGAMKIIFINNLRQYTMTFCLFLPSYKLTFKLFAR